MRAFALTSMVVIAGFLSGTARGQSKPVSVVVGTRYESWTEDLPGPDGDPLKQMSGYATASIPLAERLRFGLAAGGASTEWGPGEKLSGLHDTRAEATFQARPDVLLRAGVSLPTGKRSLDASESRIARGMADRTKAVSVSEPGEGLDLTLGAAWSFRAGNVAGAVAASYLRKGKYELLESQGDYQPGSQVNTALSFEGGSRRLSWKTSAVLSVNGKDELGGLDFFQFGNRWRFEEVVRGASRWSWQLRARAILAGANTTAINGDLNRGADDEPGAGWYFDASAALPLSGRTQLLTLLGSRFINGGTDGTGGGRRFDIGTGITRGLSRETSLTARGRYSFGKEETVQGQDDANLTGFGLDVSLAYHR